jgi:large subunit ribosomal protein L10
MSSTAIREQKIQKVSEIKESLTKAKSFVLVDYKGITVAQDTELRNALRAAGVQYQVLKNRLLKIALNDLGYAQFDAALNGLTAVAMGMKDLAAPAKILVEKSAAFKKIKIKCGMADGEFLTEDGCKSLATLPSKEILIAQLLGMLQAPIASLARAVDAIAKKQA